MTNEPQQSPLTSAFVDAMAVALSEHAPPEFTKQTLNTVAAHYAAAGHLVTTAPAEESTKHAVPRG